MEVWPVGIYQQSCMQCSGSCVGPTGWPWGCHSGVILWNATGVTFPSFPHFLLCSVIFQKTGWPSCQPCCSRWLSSMNCSPSAHGEILPDADATWPKWLYSSLSHVPSHNFPPFLSAGYLQSVVSCLSVQAEFFTIQHVPSCFVHNGAQQHASLVNGNELYRHPGLPLGKPQLAVSINSRFPVADQDVP